MNREQILESNALKRRFIKDCNLPISLTDNPYFMQRLEIIDNMSFGAVDKFNTFCDSLADFANEQEYFEEYTRVKEVAMDHIKQSDGYQRFIESDFILTNTYPKGDLYKEYNDGEAFISIDMNKANFSALNYYDCTIFSDNGTPVTWEDFLSKFTDNEHIIKSKYIRQVIMGNCNPKRQIKYEESLMQFLTDHILSVYPELDIYSVKCDEILIKINKPMGFSADEFKATVTDEPNGIGKLTSVDIFQISKIDGTSGWLLEYYGKSEPKFKCLDADTYHQYVKHYFNIPITEDDLVFRYNGKLAKCLEEVKNPWIE